jgi:hypothetical protein
LKLSLLARADEAIERAAVASSLRFSAARQRRGRSQRAQQQAVPVVGFVSGLSSNGSERNAISGLPILARACR